MVVHVNGILNGTRVELDQPVPDLPDGSPVSLDLRPRELSVDEKRRLVKPLCGSLANDPSIGPIFEDIENKSELVQLLGLAEGGEGVRIFIGSENRLFSLSGSSLIVAPYRNSAEKIVGVLGIIGPTRMNYARIVPMVDYTAKAVGRLLS